MKLRKLSAALRPDRRSTVLVAVIVVAAMPILVRSVRADIPDATTHAITGCYALSGGSLRVIDTADTPDCRAEEHRLEWNQAGPGLSEYEVVTNVESIGPGDLQTIGVTCPGAKKPLGGGAQGNRFVANPVFHIQQEALGILGTNPTPTGWIAMVKNDNAFTVRGVVYATCANV